jgi:SSS family solute:Na+ symporter
MSTADSQLFALGAESQVAIAKDETKLNVSSTKLIILLFALISFILSLLSNTELVLLARVSFVGTAFIAPMILLAILSKEKKLNIFVPILTFITLLIFLLISFKFIPHIIFGLRLDLILLVTLSLTTTIHYFIKKG